MSSEDKKLGKSSITGIILFSYNIIIFIISLVFITNPNIFSFYYLNIGVSFFIYLVIYIPTYLSKKNDIEELKSRLEKFSNDNYPIYYLIDVLKGILKGFWLGIFLGIFLLVVLLDFLMIIRILLLLLPIFLYIVGCIICHVYYSSDGYLDRLKRNISDLENNKKINKIKSKINEYISEGDKLYSVGNYSDALNNYYIPASKNLSKFRIFKFQENNLEEKISRRIKKTKNKINQINLKKISTKIQEGIEFYNLNKWEKALNIFRITLEEVNKLYSSNKKTNLLNELKKRIDDSISSLIAELIKKSKKLKAEMNSDTNLEDYYHKAISLREKSFKFADGLYDDNHRKKIKKEINNIFDKIVLDYLNLSRNTIEKLIKKSKFKKALKICKRLLGGIDKIYDKEQKEKQKQNIRALIDEINLEIIKAIIKKVLQLKNQLKFNKALKANKKALLTAENINNKRIKYNIITHLKEISKKTHISKIKKTILNLSTKFPRLQISEIAEECGENPSLITSTVQKMIENSEIYAKYFMSSESVAFDQQANIKEIDSLMTTFKEWEGKDVGKVKTVPKSGISASSKKRPPKVEMIEPEKFASDIIRNVKQEKIELKTFRGVKIPKIELEIMKDLESLCGKKLLKFDGSYNKKEPTIGFSVKDQKITEIILDSCGINTLPESIRKLVFLKRLNLRNNNLKTLPKSIGQLYSLERLNLRENDLSSLPETIKELSSLKELFIDKKDLKLLPKSVKKSKSFNYVIFLKFRGEEIVYEDFNVLKEMESLVSKKFLSMNDRGFDASSKVGFATKDKRVTNLAIFDVRFLKNLPKSIGKLTSLRMLNSYNNDLKKIPESIGNLKSLEKLFLFDNKIKKISESIGNLSSLKEFDLKENDLSTLSKSIGNLNSLEKLELGDNKLSTLPESIGKLKSLKSLSLHRNDLKTLPESIGKLKSLKSLSLHRNDLKTLPESIGKLKSLKSLSLHRNDLKTLPESIGKLKSLEKLRLDENDLTTLPESIGNLSSLKELWLKGNDLSTLPWSIGNLSSLRKLRLKGNDLSTLPVSIGNLSSLKKLYLYDNKIKNLPESLKKLEKQGLTIYPRSLKY